MKSTRVDTGVVDGSFGGGWSIFFGAEHNHKQKNQKDAKTDKNSGINNFLHAENDDFCFGTHGGDLRGCLIQCILLPFVL